MKAVVIGGGIVGLSSAYYLSQAGWQVTVADKGDFENNCSFGNAGYICPSHFVPLASPGIVKQGLFWMFNPESPFYINPKPNLALLRWGFLFMRSSTARHAEKCAVPLRDIALLSKRCYEDWLDIPGFSFCYQRKGLLEYFLTKEKEQHAVHVAEEARALGLDATVLSADEVQAMEPFAKLNLRGALYFSCDAHLHPGRVMQQMRKFLEARGVLFKPHCPVSSFNISGKKVHAVVVGNETLDADCVVLAAGSWSYALGRQLGIRLPLVGGRGYSLTFPNSHLRLNHPAVLMEGRVALTPLDDENTRLGGTMEITHLDAPPRMSRVHGIIKAAMQYFPDAHFPAPSINNLWYGYRPCSADGLPFIGRLKNIQNAVVATGHAMVGMSLGAATGKLVGELVNEQTSSLDLKPFDPHRFD
jgi:D-amino-acid dehydrogenase